MQTSEAVNELATALAKAQGQIKGAVKDTENPHFRSKYADLASVWDACREALSKNGLSVIQAPRGVVIESGWTVEVETRLLHSSGQWMGDTITVPVGKPDAQGVGSALTYARRYALASFVGVAPEDDDGNAAVAGTSHEAPRPRSNGDGGFISEPQRARFFAVSKAKGWTNDQVKKMLGDCHISESAQINRAQYDDLVSTLEAGPGAYEVGF